MAELTETQSLVLTAEAQRSDNISLPLPNGLAGAAAKMAVTKMIENVWLQEVDADLRRNEPLWRETGDGHGTTLVVTDAGLLAIGIEPVVVKTMVGIREHAAGSPVPKQTTLRHPARFGPRHRWRASGTADDAPLPQPASRSGC